MAVYTANIKIKATPQEVFDALTKPELVKLWQFGKRVVSNWKAGGEIIFVTEYEGKLLKQHGVILEIKTNEFLKYNLFTPKEGLEDKPENYNITTYKLSPENNYTRVEIIQEDNRATSFEPVSLIPVLTGLKKAIESFEK